MSGNSRRLLRTLRRVAVLLIVGAPLVIYLAGGSRLFRPEWRIVSDDGGAIRHVACVVNSARRAALRNAPLITRVVNALPTRTRVTILTNDRAAFIVARNPDPKRVEFLDLPAESAFTIWPQDPFLVLVHRDGKRMLLVSGEFDRADDRLIPERLAEHLRLQHRAGKLSFEGGNIVAGTRHVFIGAETIRSNALRLKLSDAEIVRRFQRELGRRVLVLGPLPQPVGHIDMMFTPLDARRVVVADAGDGARLARRELRRNPKAVRAFEQACEEYYFGDPHIRMLRGPGGKPIRPPHVVEQTAGAAEDSRAIAADLDKLAGELRRWGYKVYRVPFLFRSHEETEEGAAKTPAASKGGKPTQPKPDYPCLTYNNVLTETVGDRRIVYLPQYGWKAMDRAAFKAWERLGYEVVPVAGVTISSMYGGSLRCCVKVLERD